MVAFCDLSKHDFLMQLILMEAVFCLLLAERHTTAHSLTLSFYCTLLCIYYLSSQGSSPKMTASSNCRYEIEWVTEYACHRDYLESHSCILNSEQHDLSIDLTPLTMTCKWILLWRNCTLGFGWIWYWWHYLNMAAWTMCVHSHRCSIQRALRPQRRSRKLHLLPERVWRGCHRRMWQRGFHILLPGEGDRRAVEGGWKIQEPDSTVLFHNSWWRGLKKLFN